MIAFLLSWIPYFFQMMFEPGCGRGDEASPASQNRKSAVFVWSLIGASTLPLLACQSSGLEIDIAASRELVTVTVRAEGDCWGKSGWMPLDECSGETLVFPQDLGCTTTPTCARAVRLVQNGEVLARSDSRPFKLEVEGGWSGQAIVEIEGCSKARPIPIEVPPEPAAEVTALSKSESEQVAFTAQWSVLDAAVMPEPRSAFAATSTIISPPSVVFASHCHRPGLVATALLPQQALDSVRAYTTTSFLVGPPRYLKNDLGIHRIWEGESWAGHVFVPPRLESGSWSLRFGTTGMTIGDVEYVLVDTRSTFSYVEDEPLLELSGALLREDGELFSEYQAFSFVAGLEQDEIRLLRNAEWFVATVPHQSVAEHFASVTSDPVTLSYGEVTWEGAISGQELTRAIEVRVASFPMVQVR